MRTNKRTFLLERKVYGKIVYWRKSLFLLPTRAAGENVINEMTRMINAWVYDTLIRDSAFKALHALLFQKPSKN